MKIKLLPPQLASQIAAGEVIERPASVLKELLENSLDAESQYIEVRILQSGIQQIYVKDDGQGIAADDLPLAFLQHATSKIADIVDLESLLSYGFRGEALASIASVAKVTVTSRVAEAEMGNRLLWDFAQEAPLMVSVPSERGTIIEVRDLFYNTPARRKFLKSDKTEWIHVEETFKRIVLGAPHVAFSLFHQGKLIYRLTPCQAAAERVNRIKQLCGRAFVEKALELVTEANGLTLSGWIVEPSALSQMTPIQYFFVNGRIVKDKIINHAIKHAYCAVYPEASQWNIAYVLYFSVDPAQVDINVHPAKYEVRFREPRRVHGFLASAVQQALKQIHVSKPVQLPLGVTNSDISNRFDNNINLNPDIAKPTTAYPSHTSPHSHYQSHDRLEPELGFGLFGKKTISTQPLKHPLLKKWVFGKPICVIQDELILTEHPEGLMAVEIIAARQHVLRGTDESKALASLESVVKVPFFSMKEAETLIKHLEKQAFSFEEYLKISRLFSVEDFKRFLRF